MVTATHVLAIARLHAEAADRRASESARRAEALAAQARAERQSADAERDLARELRALAETIAHDVPQGDAPSAAPTWRERLWTVPAETRLVTVGELSEALGWSESAIYHLLSDRSDSPRAVPIPHRKRANGTLEFVAGEIRSWLMQTEVIRQAGVLVTDAAPLATARRVRRSPQRRRSAHGVE